MLVMVAIVPTNVSTNVLPMFYRGFTKVYSNVSTNVSHKVFLMVLPKVPTNVCIYLSMVGKHW
jgi:hypothetical protein